MSIRLSPKLFVWMFISAYFNTIQGEISIPKWPKQIETFVRYVIEESNEEGQVQVYYDKDKNSIAIITGVAGEDREIDIYLFDSDEWLQIKDTECRVNSIPDASSSIIAYSFDKNKRKYIADIASLIFFNPNDKTEIADLSTLVNGIPVQQWNTDNLNVQQLDAVCNIKHSLTTSQWNNPGYKSCDDKVNQPCGQIVLMEVDCYNKKEDEGLSFKAEFFNTKNYISNAEIFQQPGGIYCLNKTSKKNFPVLPKYFAFEFETYDLTAELQNKDVWNFHQKIWFDKGNKLVRRDELQLNFETLTTIIEDYDRRIVYSLSRKDRKCNMWNLSNDDIMEKSAILPGESFPWFPESSAKEPQYVGQRKKHDLLFEVWSNQYKKDDSLLVSDYYFLNERGLEDKEVTMLSPAFIEIRVIQDHKITASAWQVINKYRTHPTEWSAFDVSECFDESNKGRFILTLIGSISGVNADLITDNLRSNLLNLLKISPLRFGVPQVTYITDKIINYRLVINEQPNKLGFGKNSKEPSLNEVHAILKNHVKNGNVKFTLSEGKSLKAINVIIDGSNTDKETTSGTELTTETETITNKETTTEDGSKSNKFSRGSLIGVGIAMMVLGTLQGMILLIAYIRYKKSYQCKLCC